MCHLHYPTHNCGCREHSRVVVCDRVYTHEADPRCLEMINTPRRRRRWCARHRPSTQPPIPLPLIAGRGDTSWDYHDYCGPQPFFNP